MTVRILPREEWDRLGDARELYDTMNADDVAVVVVEKEGEIVARLAVLRIPHWEGYWMAPAAEGNAGITRALLRGATAVSREWAPHWIYANAAEDAMCKTLERLGGNWLPIHTFQLPIQRLEMEDVCLRQS